MLLDSSWQLLGRSWPLLGRSWPLLGRSWAALGRSWPRKTNFKKVVKNIRKNNGFEIYSRPLLPEEPRSRGIRPSHFKKNMCVSMFFATVYPKSAVLEEYAHHSRSQSDFFPYNRRRSRRRSEKQRKRSPHSKETMKGSVRYLHSLRLDRGECGPSAQGGIPSTLLSKLLKYFNLKNGIEEVSECRLQHASRCCAGGGGSRTHCVRRPPPPNKGDDDSLG